MTHTIGIYLFDDVEVLDFAGPFEVFSTASRVHSRLHPDSPSPFEVFTVSESDRAVRTRGGLFVSPHFLLTHHPPINVLIIPGGVVTAQLSRTAVTDWIARVAPITTVTASVCTGAFLLAQAGLLRGKRATTHWEDINDLRSAFPDIDVQSHFRWVDTGKVVTSAGISAGLDMSLHLVSRLEGEELAIRTARQMEYTWRPPPETPGTV
jgi:transcriptional regulator GlxA family with amidase domain